ncbi:MULTISPECIES: pyridoxamine 5'-phosphate oxidase [Janthinobacterium]|uniref:pyridoxamine 5'-phosphate oxidase n=1 Tax=Janthinobacterium TaxID=29580 RepID=UPI0008932F4D|nr:MULTISPECIES: pyridoxamine 5'-phosphate oxidase [Janthinobacterium]MCC7695237.1 pyridoxamine 5'-phosphate oxidase [Janthinobacterium sp. EB271-G4-7A]MCC7715397.1 pyridoxamine 5'-phosphate oxidase [Janthinobacterium lividum]OEZ59527.1 pyridoxine/pyridoxamine 5'-phosphate oxidase [Janthinobacterium lividum]WQE28573.1 pyridoxamine 5'-phosphate oxidase [Janthinobacterium lividum]STQ99520.1 Pyridoxine/pyridoxamine 5'-phosphate oxidase [Janthinobacterium lividum]
MTSPLFDSVPGFDQPIAVLKHCHDKIRKQLTTLQNLLGHLGQNGNTPEAQQAAKAVLQYFNKAAHLHHDDEEQDLMPMLQATATGEDAALLATLVPEILADHQRMDQAWLTLRPELDAIAAGTDSQLSHDGVRDYAAAYQAHMAKEEGQLAPMAKRLFSAQQMEQLGTAMQRRRGIAPDAPEAAVPDAAAVLAAMRTDYVQSSLNETDVLADPIAQFQKWFAEAVNAQVMEPNAMDLSTVTPDGKPSSRIVLIKQFDERGFTWYTNYHSDKGQQLEHNPNAALLFFWRELERQVRIEGTVVKTTAAESDEYFNVRPVQSRLSAIASQQSTPIASRAELESHYAAVAAAIGDAQPPRPAHWGGYRLQPERIEFWQGRRSRFHDRIVFTRGADGQWSMQRLQP